MKKLTLVAAISSMLFACTEEKQSNISANEIQTVKTEIVKPEMLKSYIGSFEAEDASTATIVKTLTRELVS
jgi:hypothetical protein